MGACNIGHPLAVAHQYKVWYSGDAQRTCHTAAHYAVAYT